MSDIKEYIKPIVEIHCPYCNKLNGAYGANDYRYGSPIRTCPRCKKEFVNRFYHEIAIDGVSLHAFSVRNRVIALLISLAMFSVAAIIHYSEMTFQNFYHTSYIAMMILSIIVFLYAVFDTILIKTGFKDRYAQKKRKESIERLKNTEYALKLKNLGYNVPEEYLSE